MKTSIQRSLPAALATLFAFVALLLGLLPQSATAAPSLSQGNHADPARPTLCVFRSNAPRKECGYSATDGLNTNFTLRAQAPYALRAPWHMILISRQMSPTLGDRTQLADCGQIFLCEWTVSSNRTATYRYRSCITDGKQYICSHPRVEATWSTYTQPGPVARTLSNSRLYVNGVYYAPNQTSPTKPLRMRVGTTVTLTAGWTGGSLDGTGFQAFILKGNTRLNACSTGPSCTATDVQTTSSAGVATRYYAVLNDFRGHGDTSNSVYIEWIP